MLRKNVAGQFLYFAGVNATTGAALTGATFSVRRAIDGTFAAGGATITEDTGLGLYKAALTQADTNGNDLGFFFTATNAVPVCINALTTTVNPSTDTSQTGDNYPLLTGTGAVTFASLTVTGAYTQTGAATYANGIAITNATTNGHGITTTGNGTGHGILATSGSGASGDALHLLAASTTGHGMRLTGAGGGSGIYSEGGATAGRGAVFYGGASGGTGLLAQGYTTGSGLALQGGQTGVGGLSVYGGSTSGPGIIVRTTNGNAVDIDATGNDTIGLLVTGGTGVGDGIKAVAGGTGVPIRGDITGNLTGTISSTVSANVVQISGSTAAADNLEESTEAIAYGTVDGTGATTTVFLSSALTPDSVVNDQFNGRVLIFKADTTTTALRGQATTISDYAHTSAEVGTFTVVALTTAPQTGDTFVIL